MRDRRPFVLTPLLLVLLAWFYWEFFFDPIPADAVDFFFPIENIDDDDNAIYSIAGLAAPLDSANARQWGYLRIVENLQRIHDGKNPKPVLSSWGVPKHYPKLSGLEGKKVFCWYPADLSAEDRQNCYLSSELEAAIESNRALLERYESMFDYVKIETRNYYRVNLAQTLDFTDLFAFRFWLRRDRLTSEDHARIFRFFHFWQNLFEGAVAGHADRQIMRLNYGRASTLISNLAQADPRVLLLYHRQHGGFRKPVDSQDLLDRMFRQEFRLLDQYYCLRARFGVSDDCEPIGLRFPGKLGETTRNLFAVRPMYDACAGAIGKPGNRVSRKDRWRFMLRDPANVFGNFLLTTVADSGQLCLALRAYLLDAEAALLRNRYLEFKQSGMSVARLNRRYASDPVIFDNPFSGNVVSWDAENERLLLTNRHIRRETYISY